MVKIGDTVRIDRLHTKEEAIKHGLDVVEDAKYIGHIGKVVAGFADGPIMVDGAHVWLCSDCLTVLNESDIRSESVANILYTFLKNPDDPDYQKVCEIIARKFYAEGVEKDSDEYFHDNANPLRNIINIADESFQSVFIKFSSTVKTLLKKTSDNAKLTI